MRRRERRLFFSLCSPLSLMCVRRLDRGCDRQKVGYLCPQDVGEIDGDDAFVIPDELEPFQLLEADVFQVVAQEGRGGHFDDRRVAEANRCRVLVHLVEHFLDTPESPLQGFAEVLERHELAQGLEEVPAVCLEDVVEIGQGFPGVEHVVGAEFRDRGQNLIGYTSAASNKCRRRLPGPAELSANHVVEGLKFVLAKLRGFLQPFLTDVLAILLAVSAIAESFHVYLPSLGFTSKMRWSRFHEYSFCWLWLAASHNSNLPLSRANQDIGKYCNDQ